MRNPQRSSSKASSNQSIVIIFRGVPGSGKSTIASFYLMANEVNPGTSEICSADDYFMQDGEYKWDPTKLPQAHKWCQEKFARALEKQVPIIIVDNTNIKLRDMNYYIEKAKEYGTVPIVWRVERDIDKCIQANQHGVPAETIHRMHKQMEPYPREFVFEMPELEPEQLEAELAKLKEVLQDNEIR